jgi:hypothetical protein
MKITANNKLKEIKSEICGEEIGLKFRPMTLGDKLSYQTELSGETDTIKLSSIILDRLFEGYIGKVEIEIDGKVKEATKFSELLMSNSLQVNEVADLVNEAMVWVTNQLVGNEKKSK